MTTSTLTGRTDNPMTALRFLLAAFRAARSHARG
jgi:hypothetical protein